MSNIIEKFNQKQMAKVNENRKEFGRFKAGDTVEVSYRISEGKTSRIQVFKGVVIAIKRNPKNYHASFIVRKMSSGIGVERTFIFSSPLIEGINVAKRGIVRRAKLYYLRDLVGKAARIKEKIAGKIKAEEA